MHGRGRCPGAGGKGFVLERRQGAAIEFDPLRLDPQRALFQAGNNPIGGHIFVSPPHPVTDIVDAQADDGVGDAGGCFRYNIEAT